MSGGVALITGPFDIVAMAETENLVAMGALVAGRIHAVQGMASRVEAGVG